MEMQVGYFLAAARTIVDDQPETVGRALLERQSRRQ
jgi:hypothetical protein